MHTYSLITAIAALACYPGIVLAKPQPQQPHHLVRNSNTAIEDEVIPSALWPPFIETTTEVEIGETERVIIQKGTRATLLRVEDDKLVVDFGREGVAKIPPESSNFDLLVNQLKNGETQKQFPNFTLQVGNKLMTFGRGDQSGPIRFEEVKSIELYILLYADTYHPGIAQELMDFGLTYNDLKKRIPAAEVVIMPKDRRFYDFAFTTGYQIPFIATHMRLGYRQSLAHDVHAEPCFIAVDSNGRILGRSEAPLEWTDLGHSLESLLNEIKLP